MCRIEEHKALIRRAKAERDAATGYRKKDLDRYVKRLEKELMTYIGYQKRAASIAP